MIRRAKWHGGARYLAPAGGTTTRISPATRIYVVTGTSISFPVFQTPYTGEQTGVALSKVLQVPLGYQVTFIALGASTLKFDVKNRRGTLIKRVQGGQAVTFVYDQANSYYGTWHALTRATL